MSIDPEQASSRGAIRARGLSRRFGEHLAVAPMDVDIGPGGITGLLGPNGSGKSTFLRMLLGLVRPSAGQATVAGVPLRGDGTAVRERVAYMPGEIHVYGELTGHAHLDWLCKGRERGTLQRALDHAEDLGLPLERRVRTYSHGMKRQLFFSAALAPPVQLRLLDEPSDGLDPTKRARILELLRADADAGTTILFSSHHLGEVDRLCDRTLFVKRGELLNEEAAGALRERARRTVRITWAGDESARIAAPRLEAIGAEAIRVEGPRVHFLLPEGDPRAPLAKLLQELPTPEALLYGELSLAELYRELYGTEGI